LRTYLNRRRAFVAWLTQAGDVHWNLARARADGGCGLRHPFRHAELRARMILDREQSQRIEKIHQIVFLLLGDPMPNRWS
jgi:hypothetical protein